MIVLTDQVVMLRFAMRSFQCPLESSKHSLTSMDMSKRYVLNSRKYQKVILINFIDLPW